MWIFVGGVVIGYLMTNTLIAHTPWKQAANLVGNL